MDELLVQYVEDDEDCAEMAALYMTQHNIVLDVAESIAGAKSMFDPHKYAAVITDWNLPDGKGTEIAEYVHSIQATFPVMFLSGTYSDEILKEAEQYNPVACLLKSGSFTHYEHINQLIRRVKAA